MKKKVRGQTTDQTYEHIRSRILDHKLQPGAKLGSLDLANDLKISRTPIRQALERLVQEGFVVKTPSRGYFVAEMGIKEVEELYEVRLALELHSLEVAMQHQISDREIARIEEIQKRYRALTEDQTVITRAPVDVEFHLALASLSRNDYTVKLLKELNDRLRFRRRYDGYWLWRLRGERGHDAANEHTRIIDAIKSRDAEGAVMELRNHIQMAWKNYRQFLHALEASQGS
ncbi:MAG: GntR family transcriptional regulator [Azospirillaceae bacterium]